MTGGHIEMEERVTVRLFVFDPEGRVLLMRVEDKSVSDPKVDKSRGFWITLGGRLAAGETLEAAAVREAKEETGQDIRLGPPVWYGEQVLHVKGVPTLFKETFVVGFLDDLRLSRAGWTEDEKAVVKDLRWWSTSELERTDEVIFPSAMKRLVRLISEGKYPDAVIRIEL